VETVRPLCALRSAATIQTVDPASGSHNEIEFIELPLHSSGSPSHESTSPAGSPVALLASLNTVEAATPMLHTT
jgi:hypothetical protein